MMKNHKRAPDTAHPNVLAAALGDKVMLSAIVLSAMASILLGFEFMDSTTSWISVGLLLTISALGHLALRGTFTGRLVQSFVLVSLVALQIHLSQGQIDLHFGVFITLALVMVYRDWRIVVFTAALFAVHHVVFDRLQAAGLGVYCLQKPNFEMIVLHAVYVVIQTALEVAMTISMGRAADEAGELRLLVAGLDREEGSSLNVGSLDVCTPIAISLKAAMQRMHMAVCTVRSSSHCVEQTCSGIAQGNQALNARNELTHGNLQKTSASMDQLIATVHQSEQAANQAKGLSTTAAQVATQGSHVMNQVVTTMGDISQSSRRIGDIIGVIDGIAFQTNILALNAAVEAARAGESGRGFAVVAAEVRSLASRSADAAKEIKALITASVEKVESGSSLVQSAGNTMQEIVDSVHKVSRIITEITSATAEQANGIGHVNQAIIELDQMTRQNASLVLQSTDAAQSLKQQAERLVQAVSVFQES